MNILDKVARAIEPEVRAHWLSRNTTRKFIDHTIAAFLEAAAEDGWRMCQDEATEEMLTIASHTPLGPDGTAPWRAMLAAAPKLKWNKKTSTKPGKPPPGGI